jgi:CDP-diacylglycerol---serine O-phosphatidyltransferase
MLPFYLDRIGVVDVPAYPLLIALYMLGIAFLLVSTIPTWSGKLLGERISRDYVLPIFAGVALLVGLLWSYPYATVSVLVLGYLGLIPFSYQRFQNKLALETGAPVADQQPPLLHPSTGPQLSVPPGETKH